MKQKTTLTTFLFVLCTLFASAQTKTVTGKVTDASGQPLVGITVLVKGSTTLGTTTGVDGTYELKGVPASAILNFSSIGMKSDEASVQGRTMVNVAMAEDALNLEDVVVVGYGTAKLKDLTSPISNVKAEEIMKTPSSNAMQAIQGKVAGVQITNNGAPGEGPSVRIRGVGSFTNENPLYVVDGMFYDNINFLNNSDIESLIILKDASSAAIYGVRAANGVVLVSTKKGNYNQKATVTYDGYIGVQKAQNLMKMANSAQYAEMIGELPSIDGSDPLYAVKGSIARWGGKNGVPDADTDWYKELLRNGRVQNHSLDITGGTEQATYSVGLSFFDQKGLLKNKSDYQRFNLRTKGDYKPYKWLKVGANVIVSSSTKNVGNSDSFFQAFLTPSIIPVYDEKNVDAYPVKFADVAAAGFSNGYFTNPVASSYYHNSEVRSFQVLPSYYAEVGILGNNKLTLRTNFSQDVTINRGMNFTPHYYIGAAESQRTIESKLEKSNDFYSNYIWDNTLTYNDSFGKHNLTAMVGQSIRNEDWRLLKGEAKSVPDAENEYLYITQGANKESKVAGDDGTTYRGASFFARATYNYDSKYMLSATMRADGSSKYQEKWGYFPSIGVAWNMTNENFMKSQNVFDHLKIRASWGKLGNDKVNASAGFAGVTIKNPSLNDVLYPGYVVANTFSWLKWEVVTETNVGFEAAFLNNRLTADFDYYSRTTNNAVVACPMPITGEYVDGNYGEVRNSGFELTLNWSDKIGKDFRYNVGINATTLKNEVLSLKDGVEYIDGGSAEFRQRTAVGKPMYSYYGYKVAGIYQNAAQIAADPVSAKLNADTPGSIKPGDVRFANLNGDDVIDDKDRDFIGSPYPTFTYGGNIGLEWKNLDFGVTFMGVAGNKIINRKMGTRSWAAEMNFTDRFAKNRWRGEGSTNKYPSTAGLMSTRVNGKLSELFVEDGSFFRIQNIQLGYTFQNIAPKGSKGAKLRLYVSADRPLTVFNYNGFTPEISNGIDMQTYPVAATYSFGVRITY